MTRRWAGRIGRCANRIRAEFSIDGHTYPLTANEGKNQLHGGLVGFHKKWWTDTIEGNRAVFTLDSPDGEEGYPGNVHAEVTYTLFGGVLTVDFSARSDHDTVVNLAPRLSHPGGPPGPAAPAQAPSTRRL
ncbi:MAG: hypothetical protein V8R55_04230 [Dysosmobacter sp.]